MSQEHPPQIQTETKNKQTPSMAERLIFFNKRYPNGCIRTEQTKMLGWPYYRATIIPDISNPARYFNGHSPAVSKAGILQKTTLLAEAEASAVNMALSLLATGEECHADQNPAHAPKTGVCQQCGRVWRRTEQNSILGICPECQLKKRLFSRLTVL
jgi:rubrerythrin